MISRKQAQEFGTAVALLALLTYWMLPGRNTEQVIKAMGDGFSQMMRANVAIRARNERTALLAVMELADDDQRNLFQFLGDEDLAWITEVLKGTEA